MALAAVAQIQLLHSPEPTTASTLLTLLRQACNFRAIINMTPYNAPMSRTAPTRTDLTFEAYLRLEQESPVKHEFVHGQMFMLAGASDRHNRISGRLYAYLLDAEAGSCQTFFADIKVRTPDGSSYYPDVLVTCEEDDDDAYVKRLPCLIIEVLSGSTEAVDRGEKLLNYQKLTSLQGYVLLSQDTPRAEIYTRLEDGWRYEVREAGETVALPCVGLELPLDALYKGS